VLISSITNAAPCISAIFNALDHAFNSTALLSRAIPTIYPNISQPKAPNPKNINRIHKRTIILPIIHHIHPIPRNHLRRPHRIQIIQANIIRIPVPLNTQNPALATRARAHRRAIRAIVSEEAVQADAVAEDVVRAHDAQTPAGRGVDGGVVG
jgi:hypothetical protein